MTYWWTSAVHVAVEKERYINIYNVSGVGEW